jgi:hypothetical protein
MGLTIEATPFINKMKQVFYLQIFVTCCMNLMNPLFSLHKFNESFFEMTQRHLGGKLYLGRSLEVGRLLQTCMMIALKCAMLRLG